MIFKNTGTYLCSYSGNNLCRIKLNLQYNVLVAGTNIIVYEKYRASQVTQMVKNLPAMQETPVRFLGWKDVWEKGYRTKCLVT